MKLLSVTVNYCSAGHVLHGLEALVPQLEEVGDAEAWIVDNHSPDDSVRILREDIELRGIDSRVRLIESSVNGGFGAGNNVAFRLGRALPDPPDYYYLLNPDATPQVGAVRTLVDFMDRHPTVGVVGGLIVDPQGKLQSSAFRFPTLLSEVESNLRLGVVTALLRKRTVAMDPPDEPTAVDWVSGSSMMIRGSALEQVGMFDETFFLYFEEVDLCRRLRAAGHQVYVVPEACVEHVSGLTTGVVIGESRTPKHWFESRARYLRKHHGAAQHVVFDAVAGSCFALHRMRETVMGRGHASPYYLRDFVRRNAALWRKGRRL